MQKAICRLYIENFSAQKFLIIKKMEISQTNINNIKKSLLNFIFKTNSEESKHFGLSCYNLLESDSSKRDAIRQKYKNLYGNELKFLMGMIDQNIQEFQIFNIFCSSYIEGKYKVDASYIGRFLYEWFMFLLSGNINEEKFMVITDPYIKEAMQVLKNTTSQLPEDEVYWFFKKKICPDYFTLWNQWCLRSFDSNYLDKIVKSIKRFELNLLSEDDKLVIPEELKDDKNMIKLLKDINYYVSKEKK